MAVNWVKGLQSEKVISSVKHFATNDQEWERHNYDVIVDERTLREVHLLPFEAAVKEADAWTVMAAYNIQNGQHCTENYHLIRDILKGDWGFQGFLISDWVSVYSTIHAANAGLDLEMPVGVYFHPDSLKKYLANGQIKQEVIDDKVRRILRVAFLAGLFDSPVRPDSTVFEKHKPLALAAATKAITLLKNENNILPIDKNKVKVIAVIGPNADEAATGGGGSSFVSPFYAVSPLEGLKKRFGDVRLLFEQADVSLNPTQLAMICGGLALGGAALLGALRVHPALLPLAAIFFGALPIMWLLWRRKRRLKKFGAQLPEAMEMLARGLRAGQSIAYGFNMVGSEMPDPIAREFNRVFEEQNLGVPLEESLRAMTERVPNLDLRFFATAVILQRQTGGDLAEILDKIGSLIRDRFRIWGQVQALTGEGRLSGIVLLALPVLLFFVVLYLNPDYVMVLFTDPMGKKMLLGGIIMQLLGAAVIRKIVNIQV